ncbi:MAG: hypothetical protein MPJ24_00310 [Pirellulaceae bacterium]|nr:hypothetical protein [Pirellulaceae bacterium]
MSPVVAKVFAKLRTKIRTYVLLEGLGFAVIWLVATFWIGFFVDYGLYFVGNDELPGSARGVLLFGILTVLAYIVYRWILRRVFVHFSEKTLALLLERQFQKNRESLITSVDGKSRTNVSSLEQSLLTDAGQLAESEVQQVDLKGVFNRRPLIQKGIWSGLLVVSLALFGLVNQEAFALWVERLYLLSDQKWPRSAQIEVLGVELLGSESSSLDMVGEEQPSSEGSQPENLSVDDQVVVPILSFKEKGLKVAKGASLKIHVRADATAPTIPEVCKLYYKTQEGESGWVNMKRVGGVVSRKEDGKEVKYQAFTYSGKPFLSMLSTVHFEVLGYDHRLRNFKIEVVDSPVIASTTIRYELPAYLIDPKLERYASHEVLYTGGTRVQRGSRLHFLFRSNKPLASVEILNRAEGKRHTITQESMTEGATLFEVNLGQLQSDSTLQKDLALQITLTDQDGVRSERAQRIHIGTIADEIPKINIRPNGIGTAITQNVVIPLRGTIKDDNFTNKAWLEVYATGYDKFSRDVFLKSFVTKGEEQVLEVNPYGEEVEEAFDFQQQRGDPIWPILLKPGSRVELVVKAEDKYDLEGGANLGEGESYTFDVVTEDELLSLLERREIELRRRYEQIYGEMLDMRDALLELQFKGSVGRGAGHEPGDVEKNIGKAHSETDRKRLSDEEVRRITLLQAISQCKKSASEIEGVANSFGTIRKEIVNNRVDAKERVERLQEKIILPLGKLPMEIRESLVDAQLELWKDDLYQTEIERSSIRKASEVIESMEEILQHILEAEDFNELLEEIRFLLEEQQKLIDETEKQRKLEVLKGIIND